MGSVSPGCRAGASPALPHPRPTQLSPSQPCPALPGPSLPCPAQPCSAQPRPTVPCPALPSPALLCPVQPQLSPAQPSPALACPALPTSALPHSALPCPAPAPAPPRPSVSRREGANRLRGSFGPLVTCGRGALGLGATPPGGVVGPGSGPLQQHLPHCSAGPGCSLTEPTGEAVCGNVGRVRGVTGRRGDERLCPCSVLEDQPLERDGGRRNQPSQRHRSQASISLNRRLHTCMCTNTAGSLSALACCRESVMGTPSFPVMRMGWSCRTESPASPLAAACLSCSRGWTAAPRLPLWAQRVLALVCGS